MTVHKATRAVRPRTSQLHSIQIISYFLKIIVFANSGATRHWVYVKIDLYVCEKRRICAHTATCSVRPLTSQLHSYFIKIISHFLKIISYFLKLTELSNSEATRQWVYVKRDLYVCEKRLICAHTDPRTVRPLTSQLHSCFTTIVVGLFSHTCRPLFTHI